jgi:hypothetical protein
VYLLEYMLWLVSWNEFYSDYYSLFSWCDKEPVQSSVGAASAKTRRRLITTTTTVDNNISTITPVQSASIYPDSKPSLSNDLASKIKSRCPWNY